MRDTAFHTPRRFPAAAAHSQFVLPGDMPTLTVSLRHWHELYTLLGTASATMVGLLFVTATLGSGVFSTDRRGALRMFLSASSSILAASSQRA
jgi:hypothetical protein